jgi:hypothetical protein
MKVPDELNKIHCLYCGSEFLVSENSPPLTVVVQDNLAAIDNFVRLMVVALRTGDQAKAKEYVDKAIELDFDKTQQVLKQHSLEIYRGYFDIFRWEVENFLTMVPCYKEFNFDSRIAKMDAILNNALAFQVEEDSEIHYYIGLSRQHLAEVHQPTDPSRITYESLAMDAFRRALAINPEHSGARNALRGMRAHCISCHGNELCSGCNGSGKCSRCGGKGELRKLFGSKVKCDLCGGNGVCCLCEGKKRCTTCSGKETVR